MRQVWFFFGSISSTTSYMCPFDGGIVGSVRTVNQVMPAKGRLGKIWFRLASFAPGAGQSYTFELWRNNSSTQKTVTISEGERTGFIDEWQNILPGNLIEIKITKGGGVGNQAVDGYIVWQSDKVALLFGSVLTSLSITGLVTEYITPIGCNAATLSTLNQAEIVLPMNGDLKDFYVMLDSGPGIATRRFEVIVNGALKRITGGSGTGNQTYSQTGATTAFTAGDFLTFVAKTFATPPVITSSGNAARFALSYEPTNPGEFIIPCFPTATLVLGTRHAYLYNGILSSWSSGTSARKKVRGDIDFLNMYVRLLNAPGAGTSRTFSLRRGVGTLMTTTISNTATIGSVSNTVATIEQSAMDIRQTLVGFPTRTKATVSCTAKFHEQQSDSIFQPL